MNVLFIGRQLLGRERLSNGIKDKLCRQRKEDSLSRMHDNRADELQKRLKGNLLLWETRPPGGSEASTMPEWFYSEKALSTIQLLFEALAIYWLRCLIPRHSKFTTNAFFTNFQLEVFSDFNSWMKSFFKNKSLHGILSTNFMSFWDVKSGKFHVISNENLKHPRK